MNVLLEYTTLTVLLECIDSVAPPNPFECFNNILEHNNK